MGEGKISEERLESINQRTRDGGAEIVKYLEKGSAFYAPAASGVEMASAYMKDEKKTFTMCSIFKWRVRSKRYLCWGTSDYWKKWNRENRRNRAR